MPRLSKIGAAALAAFGWTGGATVTASYLVVAGGGGGGANHGGGGGAGGYQTGTTSLNPTLAYTVIVGAGGAGRASGTGAGSSGSNSQLGSLTASVGGGAGGGATTAGSSGGSGGGGGNQSAGGTATSGQGNAGGAGFSGAPFDPAGGGGGAGAAGGSPASGSSPAGSGGNGLSSSISGSSVTYAGGGGGGLFTGGTVGSGGTGGGGAGSFDTAATSGTANLGGGGGGGGSGAVFAGTGGKGGSGVVIISYPAPQKFGGGIVTTSGSNVIHTFNTSGTLTPLSSLTASYLIVAGGGGAGSHGGGGAGGYLTGSGLTIDTNSNYVVTVGAGGAGVASGAGGGGVNGSAGANSSFSAYATASVGGGYGGGYVSGVNGGTGGSGGGGGYFGTAGSATSGQGYAGGAGNIGGAGGGGAGAVGLAGAGSGSAGVGGNGGVGLASSISGTSTYYAGGGGGGGGDNRTGGSAGTGGNGGGGNGAAGIAVTGSAGTTNTGGGGGGGGSGASTNYGGGGAGGSGVVIISYAGATQQMAGGTVTISGGNVIHTFTSSGYLTPIKYVNNSLRFRSSASAYLSRTPSVAGNRLKWTLSFWMKIASIGADRKIFSTSVASTPFSSIYLGSDDRLTYYEYTGSNYVVSPAQVFRDPAAWYHVVVTYDSAQATAANRTLMYVNGTVVTAFNSSSYVPQNTSSQLNSAVATYVAQAGNSSGYFDGYMTEFNFIDGQALTPNSFGTFNSYGVWQPITYGGSYGTNGFYLPFTNKTSTTTLGYDFSPNGNNWTTNNISLTAGSTYDSMTDVPTLTSATAANYATLNPVNLGGTSITLSNGNLFATFAGASWFTTSSTMGMVGSGKYYFEFTKTDTSSQMVGIFPPTASISSFVGNDANGYGYFSANGYLYNNAGGSITFGATFTTGDVIGVAFDASTGKLWFSKNNTWQASGSPSTGANPAATASTAYTYMAAVSTNGSGVGTVNFGQIPFTYTPPTGFVALNTYNL